MKKGLYYVYYRLLDMHSRGEGIIFGAFVAIFTTSLLVGLNIFTIMGLLRKIEIIPFFFSKPTWISFLVLLFIIDYFLLFHNKKYEKIIFMFTDESKSLRTKKGWLILLYIFLSFLVFIMAAMYKPGQI